MNLVSLMLNKYWPVSSESSRTEHGWTVAFFVEGGIFFEGGYNRMVQISVSFIKCSMLDTVNTNHLVYIACGGVYGYPSSLDMLKRVFMTYLTSPPFSLTLSTRATYRLRVGKSADLKNNITRLSAIIISSSGACTFYQRLSFH